MTGKIHSIETFGTVDGPGVRYVIFMQGCPLRCAYCHNPDSWDITMGKTEEVESIVADIKKYTHYIEGVTVTGGEPLLQLDFVIELFKKIKELNLTTAIDTSGSIFDIKNELQKSKLKELLKVTDLVMLDIKHIHSKRHILLTGKPNENILKFCNFVDNTNTDIWLRYVLVPTINDSEKDLKDWNKFARTIKNLKKIEVLPYHTLGVHKYAELGLDYSLKHIKEPTNKEVEFAKNILLNKGNL